MSALAPTLPLRTLSLVTALALALLPAVAQAGGQIHRCESADGVRTYTDQPCASMGAITIGPSLSIDSGKPIEQPEWSDDGLGAMCAAPSLQALPGAVSRAFASGDVNDLSSLYHWSGLTNNDARHVFGRFRSLLSQPLRNVGVAGYSPSGGMQLVGAGLPTASGLGAELWLELGSPQAPTQVRFDVIENAGCVWLQFG